MDVQYDLMTIGAGPAGMTAAIYAARAGLKVAMIEGSAPGGKMIKTYEIGNYPGLVSISGVDLALQMFDHTQNLEVEYIGEDVQAVHPGDGYLEVVTNMNTWTSRSVIVATGTQERLMGIPGEAEYTGKGVSYCAVCDGSFFRGKDVAVIGGGNAALEEALYLTQFVNKLYIVIRRDVFRAEQMVQDKVENNPKIEIVVKHVPYEVIGEGSVTGIVLDNVDTHEKMTLAVSGVFPYIGADPCTGFVRELGICDERGYIKVNEKMETGIPGLYGAGDCIVKNLRQVVTACNDGAIAAQEAFHYIKG